MNLGSAVAPLLKLGGARAGRRQPADPAARPVARPRRRLRLPLTPGRPALLARPEFQGDVPRRPAQRAAASSWPRRSTTSSCSPATGEFRLDEVKVPVRWWHGRPRPHRSVLARAEHVVSRLPDAELFHLPGESHLAGGGAVRRFWLTCWRFGTMT